MKALLASPRGFCAGVARAIDTVKLALEVYGTPIYVKHAIVHNDHVVKDLENQGVIFVEKVEDVPQKAKVIFSAHGSPPGDFQLAYERELNLIDATCPLVSKVHLEAKKYAQDGYVIVLVGHKNHIEVKGTLGEAPDHVQVVESLEDVKWLELDDQREKIIILSQTTLSVDDTKEIIKAVQDKYPKAILPPASDICYATTNRQQAVKKLANKVELMLVVGSASSSNTNRLVEVAESQGVPAYRIGQVSEISDDWLDGVQKVGISSGASVPENLVQEVVSYLKQNYQEAMIGRFEFKKELVWFGLPLELVKAAQVKGVGSQIIKKHANHSSSKMRV